MRAVVQRVIEADVIVDNVVTGSIKKGLMVMIGVEEADDENDASYMAGKITGLRIFEDSDEKMNLSIKDVNGQILAVSQFTLFGDARKGKRPSFIKAARPEEANRLYRYFIELIKNEGIHIEEGVFQAEMLVRIYNDGPVTILLDSKKTF